MNVHNRTYAGAYEHQAASVCAHASRMPDLPGDGRYTTEVPQPSDLLMINGAARRPNEGTDLPVSTYSRLFTQQSVPLTKNSLLHEPDLILDAPAELRTELEGTLYTRRNRSLRADSLLSSCSFWKYRVLPKVAE